MSPYAELTPAEAEAALAEYLAAQERAEVLDEILADARVRHGMVIAEGQWWMHYWALGDPVRIARTLHTALATTGVPLGQKPGAERPIALNIGAIDKIIGSHGNNENGVLRYHIPVSQPVTDTRAHITLPF